MAKDPAVLWYFGDWAGGTMTMTRHQKGCYIDLLCAQFNNGKLSLDEIKTVLGEDFGSTWPTLQKKFEKDESGLFFNKRLQEEKDKRIKYSESRRSNRNHMKQHMNNHMSAHMENENENKDILKKGECEGEGFNQVAAFEEFWNEYPAKGRLYRSASLRVWCEIVVRREESLRIRTALAKYTAHLKANSDWGKQPKTASKWLLEWDDWEHHVEPEKPNKTIQKPEGRSYDRDNQEFKQKLAAWKKEQSVA